MIDNLERWYERADKIDIAEGREAYLRYHRVMRDLADHYDFDLAPTIAAFVSLSPNSDYLGNLRSTASVLEAVKIGRPIAEVQVSTYRHCLARAYAYASGAADFLQMTKGKKIRSFYLNLVDPSDPHPVTIDGHMVGIWRDQPLTMKEAIPKAQEYDLIADACRELAGDLQMLPCQLQAVLWFARKRTLNIRYDPQLDLFAGGEAWQTYQRPEHIRPYPRRSI